MRQSSSTQSPPFHCQVIPAALLCTLLVACSRGGGGSSGSGGTDKSGPDISSIDPPSGDFQGGTLVTLTGSGFSNGVDSGSSIVKFGAEDALALEVIDDNTLTCLSPAGGAGDTAVVVLINSLGSTGICCFEYTDTTIDDPHIDSIDPNIGDPAGGTLVTITGSQFTEETLGETTVLFGEFFSVDAAVVDDMTILCSAPGGEDNTTVDITVSNPRGSAVLEDAFSYLDPRNDPILDAIDPSEGSAEGGEVVTLSGSQFTEEIAGETSVLFGETPGSEVLVLDDETITCKSPPGEEGLTVGVSVSNPRGTSAAVDYLFIDPTADDPQVTGLDPAIGEPMGGTLVMITGAQFALEGAGETTVEFGDLQLASDVVVVDDMTITCVSPPGVNGETVDVTVSNALGSDVLEDAFLYDDSSDNPVILSIDPAEGHVDGGTLVTISGMQFTELNPGETSVEFGGEQAANVIVVSDSMITCETPAGLDNQIVDVAVMNDRGADLLEGAFTFFDPSDDPSIAGIDPSEGDFAGGTAVTITGSQFSEETPGETSVEFGGQQATDVVVQDDATITCSSPAGEPGSTAVVSVHNPRGSSSYTGFTYTGGGPILSSIDPAEGEEAGGELITLSGERFTSANAGETFVSFGGALATSVVVVDDSTITCLSPAGEGVVSVSVSNDLGASELPDSFTFVEDPVALAVDIDGDGLMDLVVGAPLDDSGGENAGAVRVFLSSGALTSTVDLSASLADISLVGNVEGGQFGAALVTGDLDGDGAEDLVIGAPRASSSGMVYAFKGPLSGGALGANEADHIFSAEGTASPSSRSEDLFGASLSMSDIDGDEVDDLVIGAPGTDHAASGTTVYAAGLRSPMGLIVTSDGALWVALSGTGSADPNDPVGTALDDAGVSRISAAGVVEDVVQGLPSLTSEGFAGGTSDLLFDSSGSLVLAQQGGVAALSNSVLEFDLSSWTSGSPAQGPGDVTVQWNTGSFGESMGFADNNTYGVAEGSDGHLYVVNAGANSIFKVERPSGVMSVFATFPQLPQPSPFGPPFTDSVPTRILAHESGFYVVNLTGFPFNDGAASVFNVDYSGNVTELATGLSLATDVAVDPRDGSLCVTQFDRFDLFASPPWLFGTGSVVRVTSSGVETIATVTTPTGIAFDSDGTMYVSSMITGLIYRYDAIAPAVISDVGTVYVFRGGSDLGAFVHASGADVLLAGENMGDQFGCSTGVGDINGDGSLDLFVGAPGASTFVPEHHWNGGAVFLWIGPVSDSGSYQDADASYYMLETSSAMGSTLAVGDVNGDGFDDLVTGAPTADSAVSFGAGICLVFEGGPLVQSEFAPSADATLHGLSANSAFSQGLLVDDLDGDGIDDILVTAPNESYGASRNGRAYLFRGGAIQGDNWGSTADVILTGRFRDFEHFGASVGSVDLDGDGGLDICVGAFGGDPTLPGAGAVHVFRAGAGLVDTDADDDDLTLEGEGAVDHFGGSISKGE